MSNGAAMNRMILAGARRGKHVDSLARGAGSPTVNTSLSSQERLSALEAAREEAKRSGDDTLLAIAEDQIEQLLDEARTGRTSAEPEQPPPSFDGGVQRGVGPRPGGVREESAGELMLRAMTQSRVERAGRNADGRKIVANF